MKKLVFAFLLGVLSIPSLSNAQERQQENAPIDKRDIEDTPRLRELLKKLWVRDEDIDREVSAPRFRLATKHAVENEWVLVFTFEVSEYDFEEEIDRLVTAYGIKVKSMSGGPGTLFQEVGFEADQSLAKRVSEDLKVRNVRQESRPIHGRHSATVWREWPNEVIS